MERKIALTSGKVSWNKIDQFEKLDYKTNKDLELIKYFLSLVLTKKQLPAVAKVLINEFGNLNALIYADKDKLLSIKGIREPIYYAFAAVREILESTLKEPLIKKI